MKRRKGMTAEEAMAELNADPVFLARKRERDEELERLMAADRQDEAPVVAALAAAGLTVESVWDLVNTAEPYPEAIPVLLQHLQRPYPPKVLESIGRALAVPEARAGWRVLVQEFERDPSQSGGSGGKAGIACALAAAADDSVLNDLIRLLKDPRHGESRILLLYGLERSSDPRARKALMELGDDPQLTYEVQQSLKKLARRKKRPR